MFFLYILIGRPITAGTANDKGFFLHSLALYIMRLVAHQHARHFFFVNHSKPVWNNLRYYTLTLHMCASKTKRDRDRKKAAIINNMHDTHIRHTIYHRQAAC